MSLGEARDAALSAINDMAAAAEAEGATLDGTNDASIKLRDSIREVETSHRDAAVAIIENGGTLADAQAEYDKSREAIINMLDAKGMDRAEAAVWADAQLGAASEVKGGIDQVYQAWLNLPENKETKYRVEAEEAERKLANLKAYLDSIPTNKYTRVTLETLNIGNRTISAPGSATGNVFDKGKQVAAFADGGVAGAGVSSGVFRSTPGGLLKFAEAGWGESIISHNPAYRDRSIDILNYTAGRLGAQAWQSAPAYDRQSKGAAVQTVAAPQYSFGDIVGIDPELIVQEINKEVRRAVAVSDLREGVGD
jgi:hypothetical protein